MAAGYLRHPALALPAARLRRRRLPDLLRPLRHRPLRAHVRARRGDLALRAAAGPGAVHHHRRGGRLPLLLSPCPAGPATSARVAGAGGATRPADPRRRVSAEETRLAIALASGPAGAAL